MTALPCRWGREGAETTPRVAEQSVGVRRARGAPTVPGVRLPPAPRRPPSPPGPTSCCHPRLLLRRACLLRTPCARLYFRKRNLVPLESLERSILIRKLISLQWARELLTKRDFFPASIALMFHGLPAHGGRAAGLQIHAGVRATPLPCSRSVGVTPVSLRGLWVPRGALACVPCAGPFLTSPFAPGGLTQPCGPVTTPSPGVTGPVAWLSSRPPCGLGAEDPPRPGALTPAWKAGPSPEAPEAPAHVGRPFPPTASWADPHFQVKTLSLALRGPTLCPLPLPAPKEAAALGLRPAAGGPHRNAVLAGPGLCSPWGATGGRGVRWEGVWTPCPRRSTPGGSTGTLWPHCAQEGL